MRYFVVAVLLILTVCEFAVAQQLKRRRLIDNALHVRARLYEPLIGSTAKRYNVDPHLLWTIAYLESRFRNDAVSYKDGRPCAYGLMQFTLPTAIRYGLTNPHDPRESIDAAARYVRDLRRRFGSRSDLILAAYNAGEGAVEAFRAGKRLVLANNRIINPRGLRTGGIPPYKETRNYVALGTVVYRNINQVLTQKYQQIKTPIADTIRQDSFYGLDLDKRFSTQPAAKAPIQSTTLLQTNSIYVP